MPECLPKDGRTQPGFQSTSANLSKGFDGRIAFVPEGHLIVARRFIAESVIIPACVPEGRRTEEPS